MIAHVGAWLWANCAGNLVASAITFTLGSMWRERRHMRRIRRELDERFDAVHRRLSGDDTPGEQA